MKRDVFMKSSLAAVLLLFCAVRADALQYTVAPGPEGAVPGGEDQVFAASGGVPADSPALFPKLTSDPGTVDVGHLNDGDKSQPFTITVTNNGPTEVMVVEIKFNGYYAVESTLNFEPIVLKIGDSFSFTRTITHHGSDTGITVYYEIVTFGGENEVLRIPVKVNGGSGGTGTEPLAQQHYGEVGGGCFLTALFEVNR